jgi:hypothetical protein
LRYIDPIRADPDIFRRKVVAGHKNTGTTVAKLLASNDMKFTPASNDITAGIAKVSSYVNLHPHVTHPQTGVANAPLLYVNKELSWFTEEILAYFWKKNDQGKSTDEPMDRDDHAMDMIKYGLSILPDPSEIKPPKDTLPPGWMQWHEQEEVA